MKFGPVGLHEDSLRNRYPLAQTSATFLKRSSDDFRFKLTSHRA